MKTTIHYTNEVPRSVTKYFKEHFSGFDLRFYWYMFGIDKVYGCDVSQNGRLFHNSTQASLKWFS